MEKRFPYLTTRKQNGEKQGLSGQVDWIWNFCSGLSSYELLSLFRPPCFI